MVVVAVVVVVVVRMIDRNIQVTYTVDIVE